MSRRAQVWWNRQKGTWCSEIGGKRKTLAKGKGNKRQAEEALRVLLAEQALLAVCPSPKSCPLALDK